MGTHDVNVVIRARDEASRVFNQVSGSASSMTLSFGSIARSVAGFMGIGLGIGGLVNFARGAMSTAENLKHLSESFGTSGESMSRFLYVAAKSGAELDKLKVGVRSMMDSVNAAVGGDESKMGLFAKLGLDPNKLRQAGMEGMLYEIADAFGRMGGSAETLSLGMDLFGKAALDMIPMLYEGSSGLKEMADQADRLGATLSDIELEKLDLARKKLAGYTETAKAWGTHVLVGAVDTFRNLRHIQRDLLALPFSVAYSARYGSWDPTKEMLKEFLSPLSSGKLPTQVEDEKLKSQINTKKERDKSLREEYEKYLADVRSRAAAEAQLNDIMKAGLRIHESMRTEDEKRADAQRELMALFVRGAISEIDFDRGMTKSLMKEGAISRGGITLESRTARFGGGGINPIESLLQRQVRLLEENNSLLKRQVDHDERGDSNPFAPVLLETDFR